MNIMDKEEPNIKNLRKSWIKLSRIFFYYLMYRLIIKQIINQKYDEATFKTASSNFKSISSIFFDLQQIKDINANPKINTILLIHILLIWSKQAI